MKSNFLKPIIVLVLILSIIFFLWNSFMLFIVGFAREDNAIKITDDNRDIINSLLSENIEDYEDIPNISNAINIEYTVLMHEDIITINYTDESNHQITIKDAYKNPLTLYIKENGYAVYFKSSEFIIDLIKIILSFAVSFICITILIKIKSKEVKKLSFAPSSLTDRR